MKAVLLTVALLAVATSAGGQLATAPGRPLVDVSAETLRLDSANGIVQMRGNVQIRQGNSRIHADEADVALDAIAPSAPVGKSPTMELRGNIRITYDESVRVRLIEGKPAAQ